MSIDPLSRYRNLTTLECPCKSGRMVRAIPVRRQPIPLLVSQRRQRYRDYEPLDLLALKQYGQEALYWVLLDANNIHLPYNIEPGRMLNIPHLSSITRLERVR